LYARENEPPVIEDSDCDSDICTVCRSRSSDQVDTCADIRTIESSSFYTMVVAHKDYRQAKITFSGINLKNVTEIAIHENPGNDFYKCETGWGTACDWEKYTRNVDWGYYSRNNGNCSWCQTQCTNDPNCWAIECGDGYCSWWKNGTCSYDDVMEPSDETLPPHFYTCRKRNIGPRGPTRRPRR